MLDLSGHTHSLSTGDNQHTVTLGDSDLPPVVSFSTTNTLVNGVATADASTNAITVAEADATVTLQIDLASASDFVITVNYEVDAGQTTATGSGTDYTLADGNVVFLSLIHI